MRRPVGLKHTVEVLVNLLVHALPTKKKMVNFVIHYVVKVSMVLVPSAGSTAPASSVTMELSATSLILMEEGLARPMSAKTARSGALFGTLSAAQTFTTLVAVFARPTAPVA